MAGASKVNTEDKFLLSKKWKEYRKYGDVIYKSENGQAFMQSKIWNYESIWKVFIISDTHFFHNKIGQYCDRPENWQDLIIERWNQVVREGDTILHLGDLTFGNKGQTKDLIDKLNGKIYMVKGNHDRRSRGWFDDVGVTLLKKGFVVDCPYRNIKLLFTHRPVKILPCNVVNIHGHQHNKSYHMRDNYINMSVEVIDYRPVRVMNIMMKRDDLHPAQVAV